MWNKIDLLNLQIVHKKGGDACIRQIIISIIALASHSASLPKFISKTALSNNKFRKL